MPRDSNGVYTLPAGNPVVSGEEITATWANSTLNDLASAMTGSLSRTGQGGMQAPLTFGDGTVSAPGVAWTQEPATGFYRAGSGDMRAAVSGAGDVMRWLNGLVYVRNADDSAWAQVLYAGGAGTVPNGSATGDTLVWNNSSGVWARQAANPAGVLPSGSTAGQSLIWNNTSSAWNASSVFRIDATNSVAAFGATMPATAGLQVSVLNSMWVGRADGAIGVSLFNYNDSTMVLASGTRATLGGTAGPLNITGSNVSVSGSGTLTLNAVTAINLQANTTTRGAMDSSGRWGFGGAAASGVRIKLTGVSGDTLVLQVVNSAGDEILGVTESGYVRMLNLPTSPNTTPPVGLPVGTLWTNTNNGEVNIIN